MKQIITTNGSAALDHREGLAILFDKLDCEYMAAEFADAYRDGFDQELADRATRWLEEYYPRPLARRARSGGSTP